MLVILNRIPKRWFGLLKLFFGLAVLYILYITVSCVYFIGTFGSLGRSDVMKNESDGGSYLNPLRLIGLRSLVQEGDGAVAHYLKYGELVPYCGLPSACAEDHFSVHIYTGKDHSDQPRLCVDGEYLMELGLNGAGRGFNMIVIDNTTRIITSAYSFDTYQKGSAAFEKTLKRLKDGNIIIIFTFDEATKKLSDRARILLQDLGSALIQNLQFRGSWYLVTQKGINGYSPFEDLNFMESGSWAEPHNVSFCVPFYLEGRAIYPDPLPRENKARQRFCNNNNNMAHFCESDVINDHFPIAPIISDLAISSTLFSVPVIVLSGEDTTYLAMTLETVVRQPGVNPSVVVVYHLPSHPEVAALADIFNFMSEEYSSTNSYCDKLGEVRRTTKLLFPDAKQLIFIDERVILAPDFISFMGQLLPVMEKDPKLNSISAWNINGFANVSENISAVYRSQVFLKFAFMIRDDFPLDVFCQNRTWEHEIDEGITVLESLVPEVSRVMIVPSSNASWKEGSYTEALFGRTRVTNFEDEVPIETQHLLSDDYDSKIQSLLSSSVSYFANSSAAQKCIASNVLETINLMERSAKGQILSVFYEQANATDYAALQSLCQCFGLFYHPLIPPPGIYKGILRFTFHGQQVLLVGSSSTFNQQFQLFAKPLAVTI